MTETPRLQAGPARPAAATDTEVTKAELDRMLQLALRRNARTVVIGHGRFPAAARASRGFASRWEASGRTVLCVVTWPEEAASWLRQATRFAGIGTERATGLVGAVNLSGLAGATADGGSWAVRDGRLQSAAGDAEAL